MNELDFCQNRQKTFLRHFGALLTRQGIFSKIGLLPYLLYDSLTS